MCIKENQMLTLKDAGRAEKDIGSARWNTFLHIDISLEGKT
jgi:hypothetical protein